jgi:broad specificity phosphatase PhoE
MAGGSRDDSGPGASKVSTLYLVRHGQAAFGSDDYDRLTPLGAEQCASLARHWRSIGRSPAFIYAGAMRRHRESAQAFVAALAAEGVATPAVETVAGLEEYDHVALLDGFARLNAGMPDFAACWRDRRVLHHTLQQALAAWTGEGVEGYGAFPAFRDRCAAALDGIMVGIGRGRDAVLFASAGSLAAAMQPLLGIGDWPVMRLTLEFYNTGVSRILFTGASASVESLNGIAHLEQPGMLHLITKR